MARKKSKNAAKETQMFEDGMSEGKKKALDATLDEITKRYGDGAIMRLGDAQHLVVDVTSTG